MLYWRRFFISPAARNRGRKGWNTMDVRVGDRLEMKKKHPCGSNMVAVLRIGMDFRVQCEGCGHEMMVPRLKIEKNIKRIHRQEEPL